MRLIYLSIATVLAAAMAVTQHYALVYYWYWTYWWLDVIMHFSGGVVITLIGGALTGVRARIILYTIAIGVLWEVYEFAIGLSIAEPNFMLDTSSDLVMDTVGALFAYGMMRVWQTYRSPLHAARDESLDQIS